MEEGFILYARNSWVVQVLTIHESSLFSFSLKRLML